MKIAMYKSIKFDYTAPKTEDFLLVEHLEPDYVRVSEWVEVDFPEIKRSGAVMRNLSITVYGVDLDVEYKFRKGTPAKLFGPPESCYEAEPPELEINSVICGNFDIFELLSEQSIAKIEDEIFKFEENDLGDPDGL